MKRVIAAVTAGLVVALVGPVPTADAAYSQSPAPAAAKATVKAKAKGDGPGRYQVPTGAYFNNPRGPWEQQSRIERQVRRAIEATRKGAYIRLALYSFDRIPVAQDLLRAYARGVHVQLLLNDHQDTRAMKMMRAKLGTDRDRKSFIYKCYSGCRTDSPNRLLHTKFYTFTKTGRSKNALFFGSANVTKNAEIHQWNDLYLMDGNQALFDQYVALFNDMKNDYNEMQPPIPTFCGIPANGVSCDDAVDFGTTVTFPRLLGPGNDPIIAILDRVQCLTTLPDGSVQRTKLAVNMHTIRGHRGDYLADAYVKKFAEGCAARFSFGLVGFHTKGHLGRKTARGRIPLRSTSFDYHPDAPPPVANPDDKLDLTLDYYSHQKFLIIDGNYAGNPDAKLVFTGSSNWGALGAVNDEILVAIQGKKIVRQYTKQFNFEWRPGNSRNAYTTSYTNFRGRAQEITRIDPRFVYRPGADYGPYWEGD